MNEVSNILDEQELIEHELYGKVIKEDGRKNVYETQIIKRR